jgi:hypothetical protein
MHAPQKPVLLLSLRFRRPGRESIGQWSYAFSHNMYGRIRFDSVNKFENIWMASCTQLPECVFGQRDELFPRRVTKVVLKD